MQNVELVPLLEICEPALSLEAQWWSLEGTTQADKDKVEKIIHAFEGCPTPHAPPNFMIPETFSNLQWEAIISNHIDNMKPDESCALWGGYGLKVSGDWSLLPQCCGTLSDLKGWITLKDFAQSFPLTGIKTTDDFVMEGHPCPDVYCEGEDVYFKCDDDFESFVPPHKKLFSVNAFELVNAIQKTEERVRLLHLRINQLVGSFGVETLSHLLQE